MYIKLFFAIGIVALAAASIGAKAAPLDPYDKCMSSASGHESMVKCGISEIARQEYRLENAWKKAFACFDNSEEQKDVRQEFLNSQRLWIKWKDAACSFYSNPYYGTMGSANDAPVCKMNIISNRAKWLEQFVNDDCR